MYSADVGFSPGDDITASASSFSSVWIPFRRGGGWGFESSWSLTPFGSVICLISTESRSCQIVSLISSRYFGRTSFLTDFVFQTDLGKFIFGTANYMRMKGNEDPKTFSTKPQGVVRSNFKEHSASFKELLIWSGPVEWRVVHFCGRIASS